jgi:chromosome segregation protein
LFLKSLAVRGFKSFADKTTLEFEPGVTVVVGPNGSGKSNLVDAVAWVLGAQGARALRGGKMDDVIFAGTAERPALGRAEVALTIDNSAGLLPIEFSEVTITRTLFRTGDSEYQINGVPCRLLDVQELLSDSGIGRQQHVIVGQGQLDAVLNARPEDRRLVIEEAAGVLKYRKRREKAQRRLEAAEANLLRLTDLLREVRRQLRPLERQADAARRHDGLAEALRAVRLHLAGREIETLRARLERKRGARAELGGAEREVHARLRDLDTEVVAAERALTLPGDDDLADLLLRVESLRERARGLQALVAERRRGFDREMAAVADEGVVETLVADAATLREELRAADAAWEELAAARADDAAAATRAEALRASLDERATGAPEEHARREAEAALERAESARRDADADASRARARADALAHALDALRAGPGAEALAGVGGFVGSLLDVLEIEPGAEAAVDAALGDALHAIVLADHVAARGAVETLERRDVAALLLVADASLPAPRGVVVPPGTQPLVDHVRGTRPGIDELVTRLLGDCVLVDGGWRSALDVAIDHPALVVVTRAGDRFGGRGAWRAGASGRASTVTPASLAEARAEADAAEQRRSTHDSLVADARARVDEARRAEQAALGEERERRAELARFVASAHDLELRTAAIDQRRALLGRRLAEIEGRLAARPDEEAAARHRREELAARHAAAAGIDARLGRRAEEIERLAERLRRRRREQSEAARDAGHRLDGLRAARAAAERELAELRERSGRSEVEEAEVRMRLEHAAEVVRRDFDCEPEAAASAPAPEVPEGTTLAGHARELERELRLLGPVNPLALSEYEALLERHEFLEAQLDDVKSTRRELNRVIRAVDAEIVAVFEQAFADVAQHFAALFSTLFPGGSGRLVLTDPAEMLTTGIDMEARPSGKMVRRLSLLSGGERSLTALAFLFAVFRARPSPFYLMDEVEAALDDVNLHRFLDLVHEFRDEAQLVIVSHQKRTMEAADVLYGVSMAPGGSSRVVSQRMRDLQLEELSGPR